MRRAFRLTTGCAALLFGIASLFLVARALICVDWPPGGFKGLAYLWVFTLTGFLPASLGFNLVWQVAPWRLFAGRWLIALGAIHLAGFILIAPELRSYRLDLVSLIVFGAAFLALLSGGIFLLLMKHRPTAGR